MEEHRPKKLLDQVRDAIRLKHYSYRTEQAYVGWKCGLGGALFSAPQTLLSRVQRRADCPTSCCVPYTGWHAIACDTSMHTYTRHSPYR